MDQTGLNIASYGGTFRGSRVNNEDSLGRIVPRNPQALDEKGRFYVVSDGMGGASGGEVASRMAVEVSMECYYALRGPNEECLSLAIRQASAMIAAKAHEDTGLAHMGATLVSAAVLKDTILYAHVGDSRLYLLRAGSLHRLTRDHLHILDTLGLTEAEANLHPQRNILSRALGYPEACQPEIQQMKIESGDCFLLCTDGLSDCVIPDILQACLSLGSPKEAVDSLMAAAERLHARDNATALVIFVSAEPLNAALFGSARGGFPTL